MKKRVVALLGLIAVLALVGGAAVASIPDSSGVIHGCRKTSDGTLRVIDTAVTPNCPTGFAPLNWRTGQAAAIYAPYMVRLFFTVPNDGVIHAFSVVCNPQTGLDVLMGLAAFVTDTGGPQHPFGAPANLSQNTAGYAAAGYVYVQGNDPSGPTSDLEVDLSCAKVAP